MKKLKYLFATCLLLALAMPSYAQEESKGHKVGGIRAGWNYSQYFNDGDALVGTTDFSSFYVGLYRDTRLAELFYFGAGAEYYQNGSKISENNRRELQYIGVPLYLKFKLGPVFALSGFEPSFKIGDKSYLLGQEVDPILASNGFDAPFFLGAGLKILFVSVEIRYHWGTVDAFGSARSQYLQLGGAVSF